MLWLFSLLVSKPMNGVSALLAGGPLMREVIQFHFHHSWHQSTAWVTGIQAEQSMFLSTQCMHCLWTRPADRPRVKGSVVSFMVRRILKWAQWEISRLLSLIFQQSNNPLTTTKQFWNLINLSIGRTTLQENDFSFFGKDRRLSFWQWNKKIFPFTVWRKLVF